MQTEIISKQCIKWRFAFIDMNDLDEFASESHRNQDHMDLISIYVSVTFTNS